MANTKMTKAQMFEAIKAVEGVASNEAMVAFIDHELDLLSKKSGSKKATKTQVENEGIKARILEVLAGVTNVTVTELQGLDASLGALSNQKISALLRQLVMEDKVVKAVDKKKVSRFAIK